jgi:hypothetical protein
MIWIRALELQRRLENRTGVNLSQEIKFGSRLIAFLKKQIKKAEDKVPKYLKGK